MTHLLCDAGGTHLRFALSDDYVSTISEPQKLKISDFQDMNDAILHFLNSQQCSLETISSVRLSFGDRNPWIVNPQAIARILPNAVFFKINDFEANAQGIANATQQEFLLLNQPEGQRRSGASKCVIGVGTGLGLAYIIPTPHGSYIQRTHGGHMVPAIQNEQHRSAFLDIQGIKQDKTVMIYEDILSGPGLWNMYTLTIEKAHTHAEYTDTNDMIARGRNDPMAQYVLKLFHEVLGIFVHQAMAFGFAYDGLYLTGGIIDRLVGHNLFDTPTFLSTMKQNNVPLVQKDVSATGVFWVKDEFIALRGLQDKKI
ncbi:MAG: glucokinase [Alphaproteobacteria bacterium]|jgi:glucokinase|nr:glucokinase [Alphaproteobacteria bacterium]